MSGFAKDYYAIRRKEGRVYTDMELSRLPKVIPGHPLQREWKIRASSADRLIGHLRAKNKPLRVLDLGCGNGWFSAYLLREMPDCTVTGVDVVAAELEQAEAVFGQIEQLHFQQLDIFRETPEGAPFDVISLGASVQYFPGIRGLVYRLRDLLAEGGEIHIWDSPFYPKEEAAAARQRSREYYEKQGYPDLAAHYHAHSVEDLEGLGARLMYDPKTRAVKAKRLFGKAISPFPWYLLKK